MSRKAGLKRLHYKAYQTKHNINIEYFTPELLAIVVANNKTEVKRVQLGKALSLKWTNVARASVAWTKVKQNTKSTWNISFTNFWL